jgi:hypothetical protein
LQPLEKGQLVTIRDSMPARHDGRLGQVREVLIPSDSAASNRYLVSFSDIEQEEFSETQVMPLAFSLGDRVRVSPMLASDCSGLVGTIVSIDQIHVGPSVAIEYTVEFCGSVRRCFMAFHLVNAGKESH